MKHSAEMRRCLEDCDVETARRLWKHIAPRLPQPESDEDALITVHYARTQAGSIRFKLRAYSHAWLLERSLPSGLPDGLKPKAQRIYPIVVGVVGIATAMKSGIPERRQLSQLILGSMVNRVEELYGEGTTDPKIVKPEIMLARRRAYQKLLGTTSMPACL